MLPLGRYVAYWKLCEGCVDAAAAPDASTADVGLLDLTGLNAGAPNNKGAGRLFDFGSAAEGTAAAALPPRNGKTCGLYGAPRKGAECIDGPLL